MKITALTAKNAKLFCADATKSKNAKDAKKGNDIKDFAPFALI